MKILLTGPKGNLSSNIIKHCSHTVVGLDRAGWSELSGIMSSGVDVVIHAAYDLKKQVDCFPYDVINSNILSTSLLLEQMSRARSPRLIFISSCAVYGESMKTSESVECHPISLNGVIKLINERMIESYCLKNNIKYEIYRVFNMYGGNDNFSVISKLIKAGKDGGEFVLNNNGISQRDFIHVEDVAKIILKLLEKKVDYSYINIGTGKSIKIGQIVNCIKSKAPNLKVKHTCQPEAEYSRADITRLLSLVSHDFIDALDFIEAVFN